MEDILAKLNRWVTNLGGATAVATARIALWLRGSHAGEDGGGVEADRRSDIVCILSDGHFSPKMQYFTLCRPIGEDGPDYILPAVVPFFLRIAVRGNKYMNTCRVADHLTSDDLALRAARMVLGAGKNDVKLKLS